MPYGPPYSRVSAFYFCGLALSHSPFSEVPLREPSSTWVADCAGLFSDPINVTKRAEILICEARVADILAEANRDRVVRSLPPVPYLMTRCENMFRTEVMHLPPLPPGSDEAVPRRDARLFGP